MPEDIKIAQNWLKMVFSKNGQRLWKLAKVTIFDKYYLTGFGKSVVMLCLMIFACINSLFQDNCNWLCSLDWKPDSWASGITTHFQYLQSKHSANRSQVSSTHFLFTLIRASDNIIKRHKNRVLFLKKWAIPGLFNSNCSM